MSSVPILTAVQWVSGSENSTGWGAGSPAHCKECSPPSDWAHGGELFSNLLAFQSNHKGPNCLNSAFAIAKCSGMLYILTWLEEVGFCTVCSYRSIQGQVFNPDLHRFDYTHLVKSQRTRLAMSVRYVFVSSLQLDCCPALQFQLLTLICLSNISLNLCVFTTAWQYGQQCLNVVFCLERWAVPSEKTADWSHSARGHTGAGAQRVRDAAYWVWTEPGSQWASRYVSKHTFAPMIGALGICQMYKLK